MFEDHNDKIRCLKHLKNSNGRVKAMERIKSVENLMIKGVNKFEKEINYVRSIPENKRYIIRNRDEEENQDRSSY